MQGHTWSHTDTDYNVNAISHVQQSHISFLQFSLVCVCVCVCVHSQCVSVLVCIQCLQSTYQTYCSSHIFTYLNGISTLRPDLH